MSEAPTLKGVMLGWSLMEPHWPSNPARFYWQDNLLNVYVLWGMTETGGAAPPQRPITQFQKIWPEGSEGSGGAAPYDFRGAPDVSEKPFAGVRIGVGVASPSESPHLASGPWYTAGGSLITSAMRPALGYALKHILLSANLRGYYGAVAVLPSLTQYYAEWSVRPVATIGADLVEQDGARHVYSETVAGYPGSSTAQKKAAVTLLADQINDGGGAVASESGPASFAALKLAPVFDGAPLTTYTMTGFNVYTTPAIVSAGGLDVDFQGTDSEFIDVIA